jgi:hypothetical protein
MTVYDLNEVVPIRQAQLQESKVTKQRKMATVERQKCAAFGCTELQTRAYPSEWCDSHHVAIVLKYEPEPARTRWQHWRMARNSR